MSTTMGPQSDFSHLIVEPAGKVPYFTPKTDLIAGTAISSNPPLLFQPLKIRGLELQNRILVSPMAQFSASDGHVTPWHLQLLGSIAMRGPGLTWTEATSVSANARTSPYDAGLWKESHVDAWRPVVEFAHSQGQKIGIQFCHAGRKTSVIPPWLSTGGMLPSEVGGFPEEARDPSGIPYAENYPVPKAMTVEDICQVVADLAQATERAVRAGFDAINIHGAHGYLIHSFLSPVSNKRTDQYGGSFENRARLLLEVIEAMRAKMPDWMPLFLRISATEWLDESRPDIESLTNKDSIKLAKLLVGKIDALDVSTSGIHPDQKINMKPWSDTPAGIAYQAPFALEIKKIVGNDLIVNAVGNIKSGAAAEELLQTGVDLVAVGRPFLKNPGTVLQFADELGVEVATAIQHAYVTRGRGSAAKKA